MAAKAKEQKSKKLPPATKTTAKKQKPVEAKQVKKEVKAKVQAPKKAPVKTKPAAKPKPKVPVKQTSKKTEVRTTKKEIMKQQPDKNKKAPKKGALKPAPVKAEPKKKAVEAPAKKAKAAAAVKPVPAPKKNAKPVQKAPDAKPRLVTPELKPSDKRLTAAAEKVRIPKVATPIELEEITLESSKKKRKYTRKSAKVVVPPAVPRYHGKTGIPSSPKKEYDNAPSISRGLSYAKKELEYFKGIIVEKIHDANEELVSIEDRLIDSSSGEFNDDDATYSLHMADQGTDAMEREKAFLFAARERKFISHLSDALQRISSGNYGVCIQCGSLIEKGRLEAVPHARMCVSCKNRTKGE